MSDFITFTLINSKHKRAIRKDLIIEFHEDEFKNDDVVTPCVAVIYQENLGENSTRTKWVKVSDKYEDIIASLESDQSSCSIQGFKGDDS